MQKKKCKYCDNTANAHGMCLRCLYRYELVHKLKQMKPPKSTKKPSEKIIILGNGEKEVLG